MSTQVVVRQSSQTRLFCSHWQLTPYYEIKLIWHCVHIQFSHNQPFFQNQTVWIKCEKRLVEHLRRQPFEGYFWVGPEICTNLYESINHTHTCVSSESTTTLELMIIWLCGTKAVITYLSPFLAFNDPTIIRLFPIYPTIDPKSGPNDALILVQIISWSFSFASTQFDHFFYNKRI